MNNQEMQQILETGQPYEILAYWKKHSRHNDADFMDLFRSENTRFVNPVVYSSHPLKLKTLLEFIWGWIRIWRHRRIQAQITAANLEWRKHYRLEQGPVITPDPDLVRCPFKEV
jgi:hypothetical protein